MSKTPRKEAYTALQVGFGERITWARDLVGLSQAELARIMGIDESTLSKIESGDRAPNVFYIIELANRLRVTTDYLLRGMLHSRPDPEMVLKLAALHPELVLRSRGMAANMDTDQADDTHLVPKKQARLS